METKPKSHKTLLYIVFTIALLVSALAVYFYLEVTSLQQELTRQESGEQDLLTQYNGLNEELSEKLAKISELEKDIADLEEELEDTEDDLKDEKNRNGEFEDRIEEIAGTVGVLDKLSKTDPELLAKYSKVYFLNENYRPSRLSQIDDDYILEGRKDQFFHRDALPFLTELVEDALDDDINLRIVSAFRSFEEQTDLKGQYVSQYGTGANTFSADQGYSEHQLGTTLDFTSNEVAGLYTSFDETEEFAWLEDNAHKYGFIMSYPKGNEFYVYEPWHWRFVGVDLAKDLKRDNKEFYDLDQREINEYLVSLFD